MSSGIKNDVEQRLITSVQFWVQFFEMAARMRVPRHDDFEVLQQEEEIAEEDDRGSDADPVIWETTPDHPAIDSTLTTETDDAGVFDSTPQPSRSRSYSHTRSRQEPFDSKNAPSKSSFLPGEEIYSSTPAAVGKRRAAGLEDEGPSWTSSIESSLHRLNEELDMLGMDPNQTTQSQGSSTSIVDASPAASIHRSARPTGKGGAKPPESPMLRTILTKNTNTSATNKVPPSPVPFDVGIPGLSTPLRRDAAKILASMNPYLPSNTKPNDWSSVVDLSVHKLSSPKRQPAGSSSSSRLLSEGGGFNAEKRMGHSLPSPITIRKFERPSRGPELQQTPRKEAATRISKDLLRDAGHRQKVFSKHGKVSFTLSQCFAYFVLLELSYAHPSSNAGPGKDPSLTASSIADPPSLSRYVEPSDQDSTARSELDLDSIMRRVGLNLDVPLPERHEREPEQQQRYGSIRVGMDNETVLGRGSMVDEEDSFDDDYDQPNNTVNPSAAFLAASQRQGNFDNSFDSNDDSFSGDEASGGGVMVHPFAAFGEGGGFDDGDSFDDTMQMGDGGIGGDTETVFGARHAQMSTRGHQQLRIFGEEIVEHSHGFGVTTTSQESPTPKG